LKCLGRQPLAECAGQFRHGKRIIPALFNEDVSVWKAVGLAFDGCHYLHSGPTVPKEIVSTASYKSVVNGKEGRRT
jgi:hypothetical protein